MPAARLVRLLRSLAGRGRPGALDHVKPVAETRAVLDLERARADRSRSRLSVIVFAPRSPELAAATWALLGPALRDRLRITDTAGWLADGELCAILPDTPPEGAWTVTDDLCVRFPDQLPPPACTIYSYPSDPNEGGPDTGPLGGGGAERATPRRAPTAEARTPLPSPHAAAVRREPAPSPVRAVAPLTPVLAKPMSRSKRAIDVTGAGLGLLVLLPLLPAVAAAIKLTSPGPVFFRQRRAGLGGRPFVMWKLRTMVANADAQKAGLRVASEQDGPAFKLRSDPRVTRLGRLLRATSIDELPQLWNVLVGDMSLVGPRPLPCDEAAGCEPWQRRRLDATPGLTCVWQVWGRSRVSFADWMRMDARYVREQSVGGDLKLIALTVPAVLLRKGAH